MKKTCSFLCLLLLLPLLSRADEPLLAGLHEEIVQVPLSVDGSFGKKQVLLAATIFRPEGPGPFPLVVLSHGSTMSPSGRLNIGRFRVIPQIREFTNRGYVVIVPVRRGYGPTGGDFAEDYGTCGNPIYYEAGLESAKDLVATIRFSAQLPYVMANRILLVGQSGGGFASLAAASLAPTGVVGVVNFAGGRGGRPDTNPGEPCRMDRLVNAIGRYAKTIKVPALWIYSENDKYFSPKNVDAMYRAFIGAGARGRLVMEPPFAENGHKLFPSKGGIPIWTPEVDKFLAGL